MKISKYRTGEPRFGRKDTPANSEVKTTKLSKAELDRYLKGDKTVLETKRGRGRPKKMKPEQAQELERMAESVNMDEELKKLEMELEEAIKENKKLEEEVDDLLDKYNKLMTQEPTLEQLRWDITSLHGQLDQLRTAKRETEECLKEEITKREALEQLVRVYV